jgi:alkylation response protein AidB-like acyl-CoA dehydrogenase
MSSYNALSKAAHRIASDAEAIAVAQAFAAQLVGGASVRDRSGAVPYAELAQLAATGLLGITIPRAYGGADVAATTLAEVFRLLAGPSEPLRVCRRIAR